MFLKTEKTKIMELQQTNKRNRIESVDALRGFALLGIIIANIPYPMNSAISGELDSLMTFLFHVLVDKKFITIFSILFGFGFYIQMKRAEEKNIDFQKYFVIRMLLLFGIGSLHAFLVWNGDIIRAYALGGLLLLLIRNMPVKKLLFGAILFNVFLTGAIYIGLTSFGWGSYNYNFKLAQEIPVTTSFFRYLKLNFIFDPWINFYRDMPLTIVFTFGNMLIGFVLGKINFFRSPEKFKNLSIWLITLGLTFGVAASFIYYKVTIGDIELDYALLWIPFVIVAGMVLQSLFYIAIFIKLYEKRVFNKVLRFFNPVGRAALSNYILQSFLYLFVFYHCFHLFRLFGKLTNFQTWMFAIGFYAVQTVITHFYLKRFNQGPLEFIWKKIAYSFANLKKQHIQTEQLKTEI